MLTSSALSISASTSFAFAQEAAPDNPATAQQVFERARSAYGPPAPEPECEPQQGDEIVVCADEPEDPDRYRIPSRLENGDDSHLKKDIRAPDFSESCAKNPQGVCVKFGSVPPPAYIIDFSKLPETPPGSDADRVGQGLAPGSGRSPELPPVENAEPASNAATPETAETPQ
ncbi:MAG: hypothetical protein H6919_03610 [Sphingomonadaceae bacterium]|nr:hypothetical protein [Sphingomonadaceae bacterium]MCP5384132.1 hypothetical protein [Altererythrobacter sp.]MCP5392986.1 hypothetical protein [Sphingomonadaceae bacterium]